MNTSSHLPSDRNAVAELVSYASHVAARCRLGRWFGALFHVRVIEDIARDAAVQQQRLARRAYTAEQYDLEAAKLLEQAARDGFTKADLPKVERAVRLIRRSAAHDHAIAEAAA